MNQRGDFQNLNSSQLFSHSDRYVGDTTGASVTLPKYSHIIVSVPAASPIQLLEHVSVTKNDMGAWPNVLDVFLSSQFRVVGNACVYF